MYNFNICIALLTKKLSVEIYLKLCYSVLSWCNVGRFSLANCIVYKKKGRKTKLKKYIYTISVLLYMEVYSYPKKNFWYLLLQNQLCLQHTPMATLCYDIIISFLKLLLSTVKNLLLLYHQYSPLCNSFLKIYPKMP